MIVEDRRLCSKEALKMIYYVIVGVAITEALSHAFLINGTFIGWKAFDSQNLPTILLLIAFLPTVCRFVHGASIHLDTSVTKRFKTLFDFIGFFLQAALFYIMAISLRAPKAFIFAYIIMILIDFTWLIFIGLKKYHKFEKTEKQWLWSDVIIVILFFILYLWFRINPVLYVIFLIMIISIIAAVFDYILNSNFYFPKDTNHKD